MALIDKASLLMVPSTYEDGTLYNVLPSGNKAPDETGNHNGYDQTRADFTFSRGSNLAATRRNSSGLIEKGRENLLTYSNGFDNWTNDDTTETSGQEGYDGTNDAWKLVGNTNASRHHLLRSVSFSGVGTYSLYAKASGHNYVQIASAQNTGEHANFDLSDGSIGNVGNKFIDAKATSVGNGWYRLSVVTTSGANAMYISLVSSKTAGWLESWTMDNATDGILIQDAQLEAGLVATDYIETGATTAQAGILEDMPRINYDANGENGALLLEPSRTNLITYGNYLNGFSTKSQISVTTNAAISPDGTKNASKLIPNTSNVATHYIAQAVTVVSGNDYVISFFAKKGEYNYVNTYTSAYSTGSSATWDLNAGTVILGGSNASIEDYGNGWYRCIWKGTTNTTSLSYRIYVSEVENRNTSFAGDGVKGAYAYGAQIEAGSYPSSLIPTHGAAVTRGADSCLDAGSAESINSTEGVFYAEINTFASDGTKRLSLSDGSSNNRVVIGYTSAGQLETFVVAQGTNVFYSPLVTDIKQTHKIAVRYKSADYSFYVDGTEINTSSSSSVPTGLNQCDLKSAAGNFPLFGNVKQVAVFDEALSDSELADLTS